MPWALAGFSSTSPCSNGPSKCWASRRPSATARRSGGLGPGFNDERRFSVFMGMWFCAVNPLVEELFWRGYVHAELGKQLGGRREGDEVSTTEDETDEDEASPRRRRGLLDATDQTEASRLLAAVYFGSFHGVVGRRRRFRTQLWWSSPHWCSRVDAGRGWASATPSAFPFLVASHAGCDVWVVLAVSALDFGGLMPRLSGPRWPCRSYYVASASSY